MANIDKAKVDSMMTMISMSLMWAMPTNTPADNVVKNKKMSEGKQASTDKTKSKNKQIKPVSIKTFGTIKKASVKKVYAMLDTYLDKKGSVDTVVIAVGSDVEKFGKEKLGIDFGKIQDGESIKGRGIQIFIAENEIDTLLPSVLMTLNEYLRTH